MTTAKTCVLLVVMTVLVLFLRRPDQFLHPYIWIEDGYITLKSFAEHGAGILIEPVNSQHLFASKLLSYIAFRASVPWAPEIQIVLVTLLTCAVTLAIALSPTHLPLPFLCAAGTLLVPVSPEVFAVSAYGAWWAGILLFLVPLWRSDRQGWRWFYVLFGGMSSPIIVPIAGVQVLRAAVDRTAAEWVTAMLCALVAIAQISALWNSPILGTLQTPAFLASIGDIIRFVGSFLVGRKGGDYFLAGAVMLALSGVAAFGVRDHLDRYFVLLLAMFVGACMVSTARLPMNIISPFFAGPRYFFYLFVLITWAGIWLAANSAPWFRMALLTAYVAAVGFAAPLMSWRHIAIDWRAHVALCAKMDGLELPVLWWNASPLEIHWRQFLGRECRTFIDQSLFPMPATSREE